MGPGRASSPALLLDFFVVVNELPEQNDPEHEHERHEIEEWVLGGPEGRFHRKLESLGEHAEPISSFIMLSVIDEKWKDHLYDLDHLKASIGFRGWGQKDPLVEYKKEAYEMFVDLMTDLRKTRGQLLLPGAVRAAAAEAAAAPAARVLSGPTEANAGRRLRGGGGHAGRAGRWAPSASSGRRPRDVGAGERGCFPGSHPCRPGSPEAEHEPRRAAAGQDSGDGREGAGAKRPVPVRLRQEVQEVPRTGVRFGPTSRRAYPKGRDRLRSVRPTARSERRCA